VFDPVSAILVPSVTAYFNERAKAAGTAAGNARAAAAQRELDREQEGLRLDHEARLEIFRANQTLEEERWKAELDRARAEHAAEVESQREQRHQLLERYPIADGPGKLRRSFSLAWDDPEQAPLLVLFAPLAADEGTAGSSLLVRVDENLAAQQRSGRLLTWRADRPFTWPDDDLYQFDLAGLSTVIVAVGLERRELRVALGGCHLDGDRFQPLLHTYGLRLPDADAWTDEAVARFNQTFPSSRRYTLGPATSDEALQELSDEYATRVVTLCVVAAMDAFYLLHRVGYDEQIDAAVEAAGVDSEAWPADLGLDQARVQDLPYHQLHSAQRCLRRGDRAAAERELQGAVTVLAGADRAAAAAPAELVRGAMERGTLMEHHRAKALQVIGGLPARSAWRSVTAALEERALAATAVPAPRRTPATGISPEVLPGARSWGQRANRNPLGGD